MKRIKLVLKATLFCLAAVLSMGVAQAENPQVPAANNTAPFGTNGNVILNYSFEDENTNVVTKIQSGLDTIPYWFSDLTVVGSDSGIEFFQAP